MKLLYEPSGGGEVVHKYCHLVIDGVHSAMLRTSAAAVSHHDYFKLTTDVQLASRLRAEIGHEYASKRSTTVLLQFSARDGRQYKAHASTLCPIKTGQCICGHDREKTRSICMIFVLL